MLMALLCNLKSSSFSLIDTGRNSPQKVAYGLYAEQLSGSAFTAPRTDNKRTWFYRIRPSVSHKPFESLESHGSHLVSVFSGASKDCISTPNQLRWSPFSLPKATDRIDFVNGLHTVAGSGDPSTRTGLAIHVYTANVSMDNKVYYNSDGDFLFVPQQGRLEVQTECGWLHVEPNEIMVIPRGYRFPRLTRF
jgi:homogentisate 1,2-dioxygenase